MSTAKSALASSRQELGGPSEEASHSHWLSNKEMRAKGLASQQSRLSCSSGNNFLFLIYCIFRNVCGIFISLISLVKQIREIKNVENSLILLYYNVNFLKLANFNVANICKISKTRTILCANISEYTVTHIEKC